MTFNAAMLLAYTHSLCVDFNSNTVLVPDGGEWYWSEHGGDVENLVELIKEIVESLESK